MIEVMVIKTVSVKVRVKVRVRVTHYHSPSDGLEVGRIRHAKLNNIYVYD
jgi:hypothetical protein